MISFSEALDWIKGGGRAERVGWNGKGMYIFLVETWTHSTRWPDGYTPTLPFIAMKTADDKLVPWLASQTDILASDWKRI